MNDSFTPNVDSIDIAQGECKGVAIRHPIARLSHVSVRRQLVQILLDMSQRVRYAKQRA